MWHTKGLSEIEKTFKTNIESGISEEEAKERLKHYGENKLVDRKKESIFIKFLKQFNDFMIIILIIASIVSAVVAKLDGSGDYIDSIIIIFIVMLNALMGVIQEAKAEKSIEALKSLTAPVAKVKRDGKVISIKSEEVVPGDIIVLEAGNYVPADCRLIKTSNLKVEEASLTGETVPALKDENAKLTENVPIGDMLNMAFSSTIVVNGHGEAVVTETGMNTKVGKIANMIIQDDTPQTPIQKKLAQVGKALGMTCLIICSVIFVIGLLKKIPPVEMFMTSVGLAVAAIPEGLPAIVTIVLSIGVTRMAKKNSIIRKLPAVETLGGARVICSDKTGTLTQNKMQVVQMFNLGATENKILELASMCTDSEIETKDGKNIATGEATEVAIVNAALNKNINKNDLYKTCPRIRDIPFDSNRKMMSTIHRDSNGYIMITKGAPDVLLKKCNRYFNGIEEVLLDSNIINKIESSNNKMAENALRVIAVAYKKINNVSSANEDNLVFIGLIGMIDPPREGVKEAVATCRRAGIKTVMITGDHIATAKAIASELGILKTADLAITGQELSLIPQKILERDIMRYSVFARVSPEDKVRIVKAFQSTGAVVAMTGDGVNDSPALKIADIGVAMGQNGTDVAKNAADMVLADDNFVTIVEAVREGRNIYENIKKAIHFLISTNIGEIVTIFIGLLLGLESPLLALQLLWVNLVTDSFPAIALGLEPADKDIMNKKPRDNKKGLFSDGLWSKISLEGIMIGMLTLIAFSIGNKLYGIDVARTMAFVTLGVSELIHSFNIKSEQSIFKAGILENKFLIGSFVLGTFMQVIVVVVPPIAEIFKLVTLSSQQWIYTAIISIMPIVIIEIQKKFEEIKFGKIV